jgi:hypothetical protein
MHTAVHLIRYRPSCTVGRPNSCCPLSRCSPVKAFKDFFAGHSMNLPRAFLPLCRFVDWNHRVDLRRRMIPIKVACFSRIGNVRQRQRRMTLTDVCYERPDLSSVSESIDISALCRTIR